MTAFRRFSISGSVVVVVKVALCDSFHVAVVVVVVVGISLVGLRISFRFSNADFLDVTLLLSDSLGGGGVVAAATFGVSVGERTLLLLSRVGCTASSSSS